MIILAAKSQNIVINVVCGARGPGTLKICNSPFIFVMVNKQIQFSQMTILAANPPNIAIDMVWGARQPGLLGYAIPLAFSMVK